MVSAVRSRDWAERRLEGVRSLGSEEAKEVDRLARDYDEQIAAINETPPRREEAGRTRHVASSRRTV
jgi:hypothetical protein